ncbi:MAG: glycosyltransferase family 4 protein, partial [bacterium]
SMIYLLRASHANEFELQNYYGINDLEVVTSQHPLTDIKLPNTKLWSPTDLPNFPFRRQLFNRLFGGEQWLLGLEQYLSKRHHDLNHDIIHTAETYTPYTHQAVQLRKRGVISKLICTCWETIPHNNEKFARLRHWKQEAYQHVYLFHTPTIRAKQALLKEGVTESKIKVIPYGVDPSRFAPRSLQGRTLKAHKPLVLTLARRVPEKGLAIFARLRADFTSRAEFRWVFDVPYSEIPALLREGDIFLLASSPTPTWEEQYGMVLIEAMATGLPIITTTCGAIPEVVGDAALLAPPGDYSAIFTHLQHLLTIPTLAPALSRAASTRAKHLYDSRLITTQLATLY